MRFHFLLTNHYPYGCYRIEDHIKLISGGLTELGHDITYGFDEDVAPWPAVNLLFEFFNDSPMVDQVIELKRAGGTRHAFGLVCHEDPDDPDAFSDPDFPDRLPGLRRILPHMDFGWTILPCDYGAFEGGERMRFLEYGHVPRLRRQSGLARDIDVLFYGGMGDRRLPLYNAMAQRGLKMAVTFGILPGYLKYDLLDRARVIADIGKKDGLRFGAPSRICTALHNAPVVISERIGDSRLTDLYRYTHALPIGEIVDACVDVARSGQADAVGVAARELFARGSSMAANLERVMDLPVFDELRAGS